MIPPLSWYGWRIWHDPHVWQAEVSRLLLLLCCSTFVPVAPLSPPSTSSHKSEKNHPEAGAGSCRKSLGGVENGNGFRLKIQRRKCSGKLHRKQFYIGLQCVPLPVLLAGKDCIKYNKIEFTIFFRPEHRVQFRHNECCAFSRRLSPISNFLKIQFRRTTRFGPSTTHSLPWTTKNITNLRWLCPK